MTHEITVQPGENLQAAFDSAAEGSVIHLAEGVYRQKVMIRTNGITVIGAGVEKTALVYGDYAKKIHADGKEYNTFRTWTLAVCADGVTLKNLSVINDALNPAEKGQEVALTVYGDNFCCEDCTLRSTQDTLFVGPLPADLIERYDGFLTPELRRSGMLSQCFSRCRIDGSVDFIFGCGRALFDECEIRSVDDGRNVGYVAAPAHAREQQEGFLFRRCTFTAEKTVTPGSIYLARPWRDYGLSRFEECRYGQHIAAVGFDPWLDSGREKTARFFETPVREGRVSWANRQTEA